jgi:DNA-3-methyladenine glycosylase
VVDGLARGGGALSAPGPLLTAEELLGPADAVAPTLLGCWVVSDRPEGQVAVRLTEVEAYAGDGTDPAAHSHRGPTPRAAVMFGPPGRLYVYFSYGVHWCANVVVGAEGQGSAVLLRAGDVVAGAELAASRRPAAKAARDLARGPARLAQALAIGPDDKDAELLDPSSTVRLHRGDPPTQVSAGPRVGISVATELPWRFWETGTASVSAFRPGGKPRRRTAGQDRDR